MSGMRTCACGEPTYSDKCALCYADAGLFAQVHKPRPEFLALAQLHGARLTGKPDGSEAIEVVFSIAAWRAFDQACAAIAVRGTVV